MKPILGSKIIFLFPFLLVSMQSCQQAPSDASIQTAIAYTEQAKESAIPTLTNTLLPTSTRTHTSTPSLSPSPTATETPLPPATLTAVAQASTATQVAANSTATYDSYNQNLTSTAAARFATSTKSASNATATRDSLNRRATGTALVINNRKTEIAGYSPIARKELVTYPDNHKGEKVVIRGRIFNINGNTELQIWIDDSFDAAYIVMSSSFSGIYENDYITIYGTVWGENCGENAYGAEVCQPLLVDAFFDKN